MAKKRTKSKAEEGSTEPTLATVLSDESVLEVLSAEEVEALPGAKDDKELGPRNGTPIKAASVRFVLVGIRSSGEISDLTQAMQFHQEGTALRFLYARRADAVLRYLDFWSMLEQELKLGRTVGFERMRFAAETTAEEARHYGYALCLVGIALKQHLELKRVTDLNGRIFEVDGHKVRFERGANVAILERALERLLKPVKPQVSDPQQEAQDLLERMKRVVAAATATSEVLASCRPRVSLYRGEVRVANDPVVGRAQLRALSALYEKLARLRGV